MCRYVPVVAETRFDAIATGEADLLCGTSTATLSRREIVDFSVPLYIGGGSALYHVDAPMAVATDIEGDVRGALPGRLAEAKAPGLLRYAAAVGTTMESGLAAYAAAADGSVTPVSVETHAEGIAAVRSGEIDAVFAKDDVRLWTARHLDRCRARFGPGDEGQVSI